MQISDEMRQFLINVSEQIRKDAVVIQLAHQTVKNLNQPLADMLEIVQFKAEATWNEILKMLD